MLLSPPLEIGTIWSISSVFAFLQIAHTLLNSAHRLFHSSGVNPPRAPLRRAFVILRCSLPLSVCLYFATALRLTRLPFLVLPYLRSLACLRITASGCRSKYKRARTTALRLADGFWRYCFSCSLRRSLLIHRCSDSLPLSLRLYLSLTLLCDSMRHRSEHSL